MKKNIFALCALTLISLSMTSCGYALRDVYDGIPYNSTVYEENYYKVWDERLVEGGQKVKLHLQHHAS